MHFFENIENMLNLVGSTISELINTAIFFVVNSAFFFGFLVEYYHAYTILIVYLIFCVFYILNKGMYDNNFYHNVTFAVYLGFYSVW